MESGPFAYNFSPLAIHEDVPLYDLVPLIDPVTFS
jgi:hypothetical protein